MSTLQLAVRFTERQIEALDALAAKHGLTRSAMVKKLVDDAEHASIREAYAAGYKRGEGSTDEFGDLESLHAASEVERVALRNSGASW
jgi:hypothetical protein